MRSAIRLLSLILVLGLTFALFLCAPQPNHPVHSYGKAQIRSDFTLTDTHGRRVSNMNFRGRTLLVYMGYSHCPDICPATLAAMSQALRLLGPDSAQAAFLFITLDPERDTPQVLAQFLSAFDPRLVGLTGSPEEIASAAKAYKVFYAKDAPNATGNYPISHSGFLYLMDQQGNYVTHFEPDVTAQQIVAGVRKVLAHK